MNMFGSSSSSTSSSASSSSSTAPPPAPTRKERQECWTARDDFFACLEKNGIVIIGAEDPKSPSNRVCVAERGKYEKTCGKSWIDYFNKRRTLELRQRATIEAAARSRDNNAANVGR